MVSKDANRIYLGFDRRNFDSVARGMQTGTYVGMIPSGD